MNDELTITPEDFREGVMKLEAEMLKACQVEIPPVHYFAHNVYAREITIPAGVLLTGQIHHQSQINIISKGDISIRTEEGVIRVKAPAVVVSPPGTKRIGYTHEETVWITVLGTELTTPEEVEQTLVASTYEEFEQGRIEGDTICLSLPQQ